MKISLFRLPQHRTFNHVPIYYDEEEERRKELKKRKFCLTDDDVVDDEEERPVGSRIKGSMHRRHDNFSKVIYAQKKRSQIRLVAIVIILTALAYYLTREFSEEIAAVLF